MRSFFSPILAAVVIAAPAAVQPLDINPTHEWTFLTDTTSQRGGSTATFARASVSTRITGGAYAAVSSGVASISQVLDSDNTLPASTAPAGVRISEAVTYELLHNLTVPGGGAWADVGAPTNTANAANDPFGAATCDTVTDDDGLAVEGYKQTVTVANDGGTWTASAWVRCASSHSAEFTLGLVGGTPVSASAVFTCTTTLQKVVAQATNNTSGNTSAEVTVLGGQNTPASQGSVEYCYVQLYKEAFESIGEQSQTVGTSAIPLDNLTYSSVSYPVNGTACVWWWGAFAGGGAALFSWDSTQDARWVINADGTLDFTNAALADGAKVTTTTAITAQTWTHICAAWIDGSQMNFYINGTEAAYDGGTLDESWSTGGAYGTTLAVGQAPGGVVEGDGVLSRMKMWNRTLTAGQIRSVYLREQGKYQ